MELAAAVLAWLLDPAHWQGSDSIPTRLGEHMLVSAAALAVCTGVSLPTGVAFGHTGRGAFWVFSLANVGRALPSLAVLALALPLAFSLRLGLGFWPTLLALIPLGIPPILVNSYVAVREVDRDVVVAARGLGMREWQVLWTAELPLAAPLIVAGIRTAAVAIVATATLGALVAGGGLGRYIVDGLARQEYARLVSGALLVALLALALETVLGLLQRALTPPGVRGMRGL